VELVVRDEVSLFDEFGRPEEGADVFGLERGRLFERGHGELSTYVCVCVQLVCGERWWLDVTKCQQSIIIRSSAKLSSVGVARRSDHHVPLYHF